MSLDDRINLALHEEARRINPDPEMKKRILNRIESGNKSRQPMRRGLVAAMVAAAFLLIPTAGVAGYTYLAEQIIGSKEQLEQFGITKKEYSSLETKLQYAQKNLSPEEFQRFKLILKDLASYELKAIDTQGKFRPESLNTGELQAYEQLKKELKPYADKLDQAWAAEHGEFEIPQIAQERVSFPIKAPKYLPKGFKLRTANFGDAVTMEFINEKATEIISTMQSANNQQWENMPKEFELVTKYSLEGYQVRYGEGKEYNGLSIWVPGAGQAYEIYITGKLGKEELEKIALSMVTY